MNSNVGTHGSCVRKIEADFQEIGRAHESCVPAFEVKYRVPVTPSQEARAGAAAEGMWRRMRTPRAAMVSDISGESQLKTQ